jgi:cytosine deaminase
VLALDGYGLREGGPASLVVFDVPSEFDAVRLVPRRRLVLRRGRIVARAETHQTVVWDGIEEEVTFLP